MFSGVNTGLVRGDQAPYREGRAGNGLSQDGNARDALDRTRSRNPSIGCVLKGLPGPEGEDERSDRLPPPGRAGEG